MSVVGAKPAGDKRQHRDGARRVPPGPPGIIGLQALFGIQRDRLKYVREIAAEYGDVVRYRLPTATMYQVNHPDAIQHVLQENNKNYHKGFDTVPTLGLTLGRGLLTNEGEPWLKQRRLMAPVFHQRNIEAMGTMMARRAAAMVARWVEHSGAPFNVAADLMKMTLDVVSEALFSANVSDKAAAVSDAVTVLVEDTTLRFDVPIYPPPWFPTPHNRHFMRGLRAVEHIIYELIAERRAHPSDRGDLLQLLLDARDPVEGEAMSDKQLRDELITLFLAGHETTANHLAWTLYLLSQNPDVQARLEAEVDAALGGRAPTVADLPNLPYARRVLEETLRLYPPAWILTRKSLAEDELCGYTIPAGSFLAISPWVMHRHPHYWENPDQFDPDRFLPERAEGRHRYVYFPFGGGPRQCIGRGFAQVEAHLALATVAQKYRLRLAPGARVEPQALVTLRPRYGLQMIAEARSPNGVK